MIWPMIDLRLRIWLLVCALLVAPAALLGETVVLKDGSTLRGKVVSFDRDTLRFETSFGSTVRIPRVNIVSITFNDSPAPVGAMPAAKPVTEPAIAEIGSLYIEWHDDAISSRLEVKKNKETAEQLQANWIVQALVVDGDTVYARTDTTVDKRIFKGRDTILKNEIELKTMRAGLEPGAYRCVVAVHNVGWTKYKDLFDGGPIHMVLPIDNVHINAGRSTTFVLGISKGKLKLGRPRLYIVQ